MTFFAITDENFHIFCNVQKCSTLIPLQPVGNLAAAVAAYVVVASAAVHVIVVAVVAGAAAAD